MLSKALYALLLGLTCIGRREVWMINWNTYEKNYTHIGQMLTANKDIDWHDGQKMKKGEKCMILQINTYFIAKCNIFQSLFHEGG